MASIFYLGSSVGFIHGLYDYGECKLKDVLSSKEYKYLCAISNNSGNSPAKKILKDNGFYPVKHFYSSHNTQSETMTLWVKINKEKIAVQNSAPLYHRDINCTITLNPIVNRVYRFTLLVKTDKLKLEDLKKNSFEPVDETPIFFKVNDNCYTWGSSGRCIYSSEDLDKKEKEKEKEEKKAEV